MPNCFNGKFVILLNVNRVLSIEEISQMGQVAGAIERSGRDVA
jgi:purine-binding chemotaxis protein CheW